MIVAHVCPAGVGVVEATVWVTVFRRCDSTFGINLLCERLGSIAEETSVDICFETRIGYIYRISRGNHFKPVRCRDSITYKKRMDFALNFCLDHYLGTAEKYAQGVHRCMVRNGLKYVVHLEHP